MFRRTMSCLAVVSLVAAAAAAQLPPPAVQLTVLPDTTLPGLGASFIVTVTNPADQPQTVSDYGTLHVTTATGTFDAEDDFKDPVHILISGPVDTCDGGLLCFKIPAHGKREIYLSWGFNSFFGDYRLSSVPGTYQLQLTLFLIRSFDDVSALPASNSQTLTVKPATGVDAAVWQFLLPLKNGKGWGWLQDVGWKLGVPAYIEEHFPTSTYAAWASGWPLQMGGSTYQETLVEYDRALATNLPRVIRDEKLQEKGSMFAAWSTHTLWIDRDADLAVSLADRARPILEQVRDTALAEMIRENAAKNLAGLLTRDSALVALRDYAEHDPPAPQRVVPRVECVTKGEGHSFSARFGYTNPNSTMKVLQVGGSNLVSPAPVDQGQPRVFRPGNHPNVFTATSPGGNLKWHLDGSVAEATEDFAVQCNGQ